MNEQLRAAILERCSKNDGTQTVENQDLKCKAVATAMGFNVVEEYIDYASGAKSDRVNFLRMLDDADKRKFDILIIFALDRLSREGISNTLGYIERLNRAGVAIKSICEPWLDTRDEGIGKLMLAIFAWVASQERRRISERTRAGLQRAKANGVQLGRRLGSKDKKRRIRSGYLKRHRGAGK